MTITYFWTWFADHQKHFLNYLSLSPKLQRHYAFWLEWHLNYYCKGIGYVMVFPKGQTKKARLIITANGRPEFFGKVEAMVAAAPKFRRWEVIAFVPPSAKIGEMIDGTDKPLVFQDISIKASEVKFKPLLFRGTKKIDMVIYLDYPTIQEDYNDLMKVVYIMVESILGEKALHANINFVELAQMPEPGSGLIQLYDLQCYIDSISNH